MEIYSMNDIHFGNALLLAPKMVPNGVNLLVLDPPYGVDHESNQAKTPDGLRYKRKVMGDEDPLEAIARFLEIMAVLVPKLADEADVYVFTSYQVFSLWEAAVQTIPGLTYKKPLIWAKGDPGMGDLSDWGCGYEIILYLKKGKRPVAQRLNGVITVDRVPSNKIIHSTEKPVRLIEILIKQSTEVGELVVDAYSGSGSTTVAAQRLGRRSIAFELDPVCYERSMDRIAAPAMLLGDE